MELENPAALAEGQITDKQDLDQLVAGWAGIFACGLITAVIWFNAIQSISAPNDVMPTLQVGEVTESAAARP